MQTSIVEREVLSSLPYKSKLIVWWAVSVSSFPAKQFKLPLKDDQMTDLGAVLAQLKKERDKLNRAIAALSGAGGVRRATRSI